MTQVMETGPGGATAVVVDGPAVTTVRRPGRFTTWLRRMGEKARALFRSGWSYVVRGWNGAVEGTVTAAAWTASKGRWLWGRVYHGGAATGRVLGRGARFFGRSTATLARGTVRYSARTLGWGLRGVSWTTRTVLESAFAVSLAAWLVIGLVTAGLAVTHDGYENHIHKHAKAMSRGEYREDHSNFGGPIKARETLYGTDVSYVQPTSQPDPGHWQHTMIEDPLGFWLENRTADFNGRVPSSADLVEIEFLIHAMDDIFNPSAFRSGTAMEDERIQALSDNELFQGKSYWEGRAKGMATVESAWNEIVNKGEVPWEEIERQISTKAKQAWSLLNRNSTKRYEARELHRNSFKQGYDHMLEFLRPYLEREHEQYVLMAADRKAAAAAVAQQTETKV